MLLELPALTSKDKGRVALDELDAGDALGAYYYCESRWHTIAANTEVAGGKVVILHDEIGKVQLEREWRFRDREHADMWIKILVAAGLTPEALRPTPVADMAHRCNGHSVRYVIVLGEEADDA
jgi:hypothetical protein